MSALIAVRRAIHGKLRGDTTLTSMLATPPAGYAKGTYDDMAPEGAGYPYVIVGQSASTSRYALSALLMDEDVWLIKGVDRNQSSDLADAIADRLDSLLTDGALSISGKTHLYLRRESAIRYPEVADGTLYRHSGHLFRLIYG